MSRSVLLVHPPHAKACEPSPGALVLAAYLRRLGRRVGFLDANLLVQEALLSPARLAREAEALAAAGAPRERITSGRRAAAKTRGALEALRSPATYARRGTYEAAVGTVAEAYRLLSRRAAARLSISDFAVPGLSPLSTRDLTAAAREEAAIGLEPELGLAADAVLADDPEVVGISATYLSQALPSFALAGSLRRRGFRGLLVLGGGLVSSWSGRIGPTSEVFATFDALVVGPGEAALEALTEGEGNRAGAPPGLLFPRGGLWAGPGRLRAAPLCFEPDPEGVPWGRYLSPGPVLPLAASRGCYWRRCAFCPEADSGAGGFRAADVPSLARAILRARDAVGVEKLHFTDDAVPPALLRRLARALKGEGLSWYGFARLERVLRDPGFADELAEGGCVMLQLGVESASQRLLDLLGKGTRVGDAGPILRNLTRAGIRTYVYLLFGAPSETEPEAEATLEWAVDHCEEITFLNLALMNLPRESAPASEPGRYGVAGLRPLPGENDLSLYLDFAREEGPPRAAVRRLLARARAHPALRPVFRRLPAGFTANHAAFSPL